MGTQRMVSTLACRLLILGPEGLGKFTPASIDGLQLWVDASQSRMWKDTARTVPAVADADPVAAPEDLSGLNHHVIQAIDAARPALKLGIKNGKPVLRFDGVDDRLALPWALAQPTTVYCVFSPRSYTSGDRIWDGYVNNAMGVYQTSAGGGLTAIGDTTGTFSMPFAGPAIGEWGIVDVLYNGAASHTRLNAGATTIGNAGTSAGGGVKIGANAAITAFGALDLAEFLIFTGVHTGQQRADMVAYLNAKWGVF